MRRDLENRLSRLEGRGNGDKDGLQITISMHKVDENGENAGVVKEIQCGFGENGGWYSKQTDDIDSVGVSHED
ncbi:hypothetical protein [Natronococcus occultus]|uniref:Uncharacterized protein n=1 Tax=Natronococcus occultus SP4 TaxID=694430 RepID=L0K3D7_9EURY|nr:hypothetical protein [Natronococcus occultus]AGB39782.1 hypothetical protein Natoc_4362 [Natronococcus occultus SP4]